jgi:diamine N-acetyltransferase
MGVFPQVRHDAGVDGAGSGSRGIRRRRGTRVCVTYVPGEGGPAGFYARLGFRPTGGFSGDQEISELQLV